MESLSICIPAHFRSEQLKACLVGLTSQVEPNDQIIVGLSTSDIDSLDVITELENEFNCQVIFFVCHAKGVIDKLNEMAARAINSWIVTIDDDAIPDECWLEKIRMHTIDTK